MVQAFDVELYFSGKTVENDPFATKLRGLVASKAPNSLNLSSYVTVSPTGELGKRETGSPLQGVSVTIDDYAAVVRIPDVRGSIRMVKVGSPLNQALLAASGLVSHTNHDGNSYIVSANGGNLAIYQLNTLQKLFEGKRPSLPPTRRNNNQQYRG